MLEFARLLLTVVLGSGAAITIFRLVFDKKKEKTERTEAIKYLAIQLAFQFEGFTIDCAQGVSDHQTAVQCEGNAGALLSKVPSPPGLPTSESYRFMDPAILNRILGFAQQCTMAQLAAYFWIGTVGDQECYQSAVEENTILMGSEALKIARTIRSTYNLGARDLMFGDWNIDSFIRLEMEKVNQRTNRRKHYERQGAAKISAKLSPE